VLTRLVEVINNPHSSALDLKNLIQIDPPLAARVLKRANSAYYGAKRRMVEILDAIVCIGFEAVKELALSQKVCELFSRSEGLHDYSRSDLWMHSVAAALCAKMIYRRELRLPGGDVYTAGLLHDIGVIVEDQFAHEDFVAVLNLKRETNCTLQQAEEQIMGFTHAAIGGRLGELWSLPEELCEVILLDDQPLRDGILPSRMASTLYIANCACREWKLGYRESPRLDRSMYNACLQELGISELGIEALRDEVVDHISQMKKDGWF
jgi:HD-like signal output (HDOD) protein